MTKRKFMTEAEQLKRDEHHHLYQLIQNARMNERRAALIGALADTKDHSGRVKRLRMKLSSLLKKKEGAADERIPYRLKP